MFFAKSVADMWLIAVVLVVPALSMRHTDHCEEQLAAAKEENQFLKRKLRFSLHGIAALTQRS